MIVAAGTAAPSGEVKRTARQVGGRIEAQRQAASPRPSIGASSAGSVKIGVQVEHRPRTKLGFVAQLFQVGAAVVKNATTRPLPKPPFDHQRRAAAKPRQRRGPSSRPAAPTAAEPRSTAGP